MVIYINFLLSQLKHILWVLKRMVSTRRFFLGTKNNVLTERKEKGILVSFFLQHINLINVENNFFLASGYFWHLQITFANSLDADQDQQNISPDLDPNGLTQKDFLKKSCF